MSSMRWLRALLAILGTATLLAPSSADREWDILQLYHNTERPAGKTAEDFYGIGRLPRAPICPPHTHPLVAPHHTAHSR